MELDTVELVMAFEEAFAVEIPDAVAEKILTVGDAAEFIVQELARTGRPASPDDVFARVCRLTADKAGLDPARIRRDHRFVLDLGLD